MTTFKIKWSELAKSNLKEIHDYIKYKKQAPQIATILKNAILEKWRSGRRGLYLEEGKFEAQR